MLRTFDYKFKRSTMKVRIGWESPEGIFRKDIICVINKCSIIFFIMSEKQVQHHQVQVDHHHHHHQGNHHHHAQVPMQIEHPHQKQNLHHAQHQPGHAEHHQNQQEHHQQHPYHYVNQHHQPMDVKDTHMHQHAHQQYEYNSFKAQDGNEVWAGALTLAWQEMAKLAKVKSLTVETHDEGKKAAHNYNCCPFNYKDLKPESRYTKSGLGQQTVNQINTQRAKHFPQCTFPPLDITLPQEAAISYSYLYKKLTYPFKFERRQHNTLKFKCQNGQVKQVPSFYAEDERQYDQVKVYDYNDNDDFILRLMTKDPNEEVFAYKIGDSVPLKDVIKRIEEVSKKTEDIYCVGEVENFEFPILDFDYSRSVQELVGARLLDLGGRKIEAIIQGVKLKLDETGVVVENQGMMFTDECGVLNPRILRIDSPFWLVMKEKDRHPYLCIRVNNL